MTDQVLVMIPKGSTGQFRGVGLGDTVWKVCAHIINSRLTDSIKYHPYIHGFRKDHGCSTAIIEVKLKVDWAVSKGKSVHQVYIDLKKAYDSIYQNRTLELLSKYGVGTSTLLLISNFWKQQQIALRMGSSYGEKIHPGRGVTQGDILSPTIFNIVIDAVCREVESMGKASEEKEVWDNFLCVYYADDGYLGSTDRHTVQRIIQLQGPPSPFEIWDSDPTAERIGDTVKSLPRDRQAGPWGVNTETLQLWAKSEETEHKEKWNRTTAFIQKSSRMVISHTR